MADLVTIATFTGPLEAHIAKGRLEAEGIPAFVAHEHHIGANWVYSQALGGVKLQVATENAQAAETVLQELHEGKYEAALTDELGSAEVNVCPRCGSRDFKSRIPLGQFVLLVATFGLSGVIFPLRRERHACHKCDNKWRY